MARKKASGSSVGAKYTIPQLRKPVDEEIYESQVLRGFVEPGTSEWKQFFDGRRLLARDTEDGERYVSVTCDAKYDPAYDQDYDFEEELPSPAFILQEGPRRRIRTFDLAQILTDVQLAEKFKITPSIKAQLKALAAEDVMAASREAQARIRTMYGHENVVISPGKYSQSWKAARDNLKFHAGRFPITSTTTEALFVGEKIFIYGPEGEKGWRVYGSERVASLVRLVHRMVESTSPQTIIFALGPELTLLDIDIHDGETTLSPVRRLHAGPHAELPDSSSADLLRVLTVEDRVRIQRLNTAVAVVELDGKAVGSAVRISKNHLLTCEHIVSADGALTVEGRACTTSGALSRDMWLLEQEGADVTWSLRHARIDEAVVLCFRRYDKVHWLGPMRIINADNVSLTYTKHRALLPGMSGAAIIALSDFSLLGIHDGTAITHAIGSSFSQSMYTDIWTVVSTVADPERHYSGEENLPATYGSLADRGLGPAVDRVFDAIVSLTDKGTHLGAMLNFPNYRAYPAELSRAVDKSEEGLTSMRVESLGSYGVHVASYSQLNNSLRPPVLRLPVFGEQVILLSKDGEDLICSTGKLTVEEIGVRTKFFSIDGVENVPGTSFLGATVLSMLDGAVVGMVSLVVEDEATPDRITVKAGFLAEQLLDSSSDSLSLYQLSIALPSLDLTRWPEKLRESVLQSISEGLSNFRLEGYRALGQSIVESRFLLASVSYCADNQLLDDAREMFVRATAYRGRASNVILREFVRLIGEPIIFRGPSPQVTAEQLKFWFEVLVGISAMYENERGVDVIVGVLYPDMPGG